MQGKRRKKRQQRLTMSKMLAAMRACGIEVEEGALKLSEEATTHSAPQGMKPNFARPRRLPAFCGYLKGNFPPGWDSSSFRKGYPWDKLKWLHSGTGTSWGSNFAYDFVIWMQDVQR